MMVPALLFTEKPYYDNLLARGIHSPFARKSGPISLIYIVMVLKTCCILYVNLVLIHFSDDCQQSTTRPQHACLNSGDGTDDGLISSTSIVSAEFVPKLAVLVTCGHSLVFLYSMVWTHMAGGGAASKDSDSDSDSGSGSGSDDDAN